MVEKKIIIRNSSGLHLRPASDLCTKAMEYRSTIKICFRNKEFNAKSLLSILSACVQQEDEILLVCQGPDEEAALERISSYIEHELFLSENS